MNRQRVYDETYREYASRVRAYLCHQINNTEDVDEVFDDIFAGFWKALEKFRGEARPATLLYAITRNKKTDFLRKKYRRLFAKSDKDYIEYFSRKLGFRVNVILHPIWRKHLDSDKRDLILAVKRTIDSTLGGKDE